MDSGSHEASGLRVGEAWVPRSKIRGYYFYRAELGENNSNVNKYPTHSPLNGCPIHRYTPKQQMPIALGKTQTDLSKLEHR